MRQVRNFIITALVALGASLCAQSPKTEQFSPDPVRSQKFLPFLAVRHGGPQQLQQWKENNQILYFKELWYFTESFALVPGHAVGSERFDESGIDITRLEHLRLYDRDTVLTMPGFSDGLKLFARKSLLHFPDYAISK